MTVKAYQCSRCKLLYDNCETVETLCNIDPRPNHREKGDAEECRKLFEPLSKEEIWHEKFSWEK